MIYDTTIIGAGPAGINATIYAARKGMKVMVISKDIGGQVSKVSIIENYIGYQEITGTELSKKFNDHLNKFNFDFKQTEITNIKKSDDLFEIQTDSENISSKTVIIATGARAKELNIPGEKEFKNKGVTYCATCDAPLFRGKNVAVIGGGNSALESSLQLSTIASRVYMINKDESFSGDKILSDKLSKNDKIEILYNAQVKEIDGDRFVESLKLQQYNKTKQIKVQGVFVEIGYKPNTSFLQNLLKLNSNEEIEIDSFGRTSKKGIFASGDCTNVPYKQIIIASGAGAIAAISAFNYLAKEK
ncbi:MAG: FAD-dependent oxidoreductase [Patescibacteria group bacterium]|nr:FAD-dependent oxidoreductase [Patescibacteria group bacterium]